MPIRGAPIIGHKVTNHLSQTLLAVEHFKMSLNKDLSSGCHPVLGLEVTHPDIYRLSLLLCGGFPSKFLDIRLYFGIKYRQTHT